MAPVLLKRVVEELGAAVTGGVVSRVHQPDARTVILKVFARGETHFLMISAHPALARIHLISGGVANPPSPLRLCAFLRSRITSARIDSVVQSPGERIVRIGLKKGYGPEEEAFSLVAELTGKSANIILVDGDNIVLDSLKSFPPVCRTREDA